MKLKESDDMRAPLAFLLGKLDFQKEFRNLQAKPEGSDMRITAEPKTDNLPYSAVEFVVAPDQHIKVVKVTGYDHSILEFRFDQEKVDPPLDAKLFQFQAPKGAQAGGERAVAMADFVLKYADGRGQIHHQVATAASEKELREKYAQQGFLIYSIKVRSGVGGSGFFSGRKKLNLEKFLIFNQQFVTLIRAGLPILKALDLLAERLTDPKLGTVRQERPRRGPRRHPAQRGLPPAGHLPQNLRHFGDGRREKRQPDRSHGPLRHTTRSFRSRCARRSWFRSCTLACWWCW